MKCFYHNDHDGRAAGSVVARFENNYNKEDFFEVDYIINLMPMLEKVKDGERVYFVDYSFKESTLHILNYLIDKNCDIIWCDHHTSSLEMIKNHKELKLIKGIRLDGISGCALIYMYLYKCEFDEIPWHLKLISDYDCWKFKYGEDSSYLKLGIETKQYDALDSIWVDLHEEEAIYSFSFQPRLEELTGIGKIIKKYTERNNEFYRNAYSYESIINGYRALVVNKKTNSWIFGDEINKYPLVCVWVFNGEKYSYSIYSTDKSIDCSKIAEKYGGGGHAGASGFSSDVLLFTKNKIDKK